jgi:hypothetical protein
MPRDSIKPGDLVWILPRRISGLGDEIILIKAGEVPPQLIRVEAMDVLGVFLRRERIDMSINRAIMPIVLLDGHEHTLLIGRMRLADER